MTLKADITGATPNLAQANWQRFREYLNRKQFKDPNFITKCWLDSATLKFKKYIQRALKIACPMRRGPKKLKCPFYWQGEVEDLKKMAKRAWRTYFRNPNETSWSVYLESRQAFQRGVRRAKRESWRLFTEAPQDSKAMSDLLRHAQGKENKSINLLNDALDDSPEGTLRHLMDVHFPGHSAPVEEGRDNVYYGAFNDALREINYITVGKIQEALASIGSHKAAGPDGFKQIVLKNLPDSYFDRLRVIYISSLYAGYVPACWRRSKVMFIPKPGKDDYTKAKSFRPITLTSHVFKTMEKVILNH